MYVYIYIYICIYLSLSRSTPVAAGAPTGNYEADPRRFVRATLVLLAAQFGSQYSVRADRQTKKEILLDKFTFILGRNVRAQIAAHNSMPAKFRHKSKARI